MKNCTFRIMCHDLNHHMCMTVHCPHCTQVYDAGLYTIESNDALLGEQTNIACAHCGTPLPKPLLFIDIAEARSFLDRINTARGGVPAQLIPKHLLEISHVDWKLLGRAFVHRFNN